jgi:hypothetical protein
MRLRLHPEFLAAVKLPAGACGNRSKSCVAPTALGLLCDFAHRFRGGLAYAAPTALVLRHVQGLTPSFVRGFERDGQILRAAADFFGVDCGEPQLQSC